MKTIKKLHSGRFKLNFISLTVFILFTGLFLLQTNSFAQEQTCITCHKSIVEKHFIHGPVDSDCTFCHESTGETHPQKGVKGFTIAQEGADLCYNCHTEEHDANTTNKYVHLALSVGSCLDCHEVHSSDSPKFISTKLPDLCVTCHYEKEEAISGLAVVHSPVTDSVSCVNCHSPHSSPERKLLLADEKTLCLSCHNKTLDVGDRKIANIDKIINSAKTQHAPLDEGCVICHNPHASANANLLSTSYPDGNYAPGLESNYELCFGCHDASALTEERTTTATNFRNGDQNLHFLHVNKEKGRTCKNCHSVHGSSKAHLLAETVKFGNWNMPLNYIATEDGGSCATGCHKELKYKR